MSGKGLNKLAFGQLLSVLQASTGLINMFLNDYIGVNIPILQAALTYSLLTLLFLVSPDSKGKWEFTFLGFDKLSRSVLAALIGAAVFDVLASWMIVACFARLQLSLVILLLGWSTPASLLFNHFWNPRKYTKAQYFGIVLALASIILYFGSMAVFTAPLWYLLLGSGAAVAYAASNNFQEFACSRVSSSQFLFCLGGVGAGLSLSALAFADDLAVFFKAFDVLVAGMVALYVTLLTCFYCLIPVYLRKNSAVSFNLSLLSANFMGCAVEALVKGIPEWKLILAVAGLTAGLLIFYLNEADVE